MSGSVSKAVFLSYASQDAEAARRICETLRTAGVEVWFDADGGLEHGDEWDAKIRRQIKECVLFIPLISANTQARHEGYFRLEWELAAERAMSIASGVAFILPIIIDATREPDALVPDRFRKVQWTRLPGGEVTPEVKQRFLKLWSHRIGAAKHEAQDAAPAFRSVGSDDPGQESRATPRRRVPTLAWVVGLVGLAVLAGALGQKFLPRDQPTTPAAAAGTSAPASTPPASEADPLIARAYALIDRLNYTRDNLAAADDLARKATELASDSARAWAARAFVQSCHLLRGWDTGEKRCEDTQALARRALALNPDEPDALLALAYVLNTQRAYAQAETHLRRAVALRPDVYRYRNALVAALSGQGRDDEAFTLAEENLRRFPRDPLAHYSLAGGQLRRGRFEEALAHYDAAIALQPFAGALLYKTMLLVAWRGDVPAARATLDRLASDDRSEDRSVGVAMWLGLVERQPARVHAAAALTARAFFEDSLTPGPKAWSVALAHRIDRQESLARQQWQAAEAVLRQRLRDQPAATGNQARLATTLAWLDRPEEAAREIAPFAAAAREQPGVASSYLLAQYFAALGDAAQAAPHFTRAMDRHRFVSANGLRLDPQWDKLRSQPEFEPLLVAPKKDLVATPPAPDQKSVAVLAFKNLSGDPAREFFSDGLSEAVTDVLGRVPGLKVVGSASAFSFKGKSVPIPEIARQLGVTHLVEGTVLQEGQTVRITAKLIQADGFQVWVSDKLDRELKNIFALHDEVAGLIAKNLSLRLGASSAASKAAVNPQAYELYVQGRQAWNLRTPAGYELAENLLTRALALEPNFARAHAALADVWSQRVRNAQITNDAEDQFPAVEQARIRAKITQALTLDPDSAEAHASLGLLLMIDRKYSEAEAPLRQAVALNPNYASAHQWLGVVLQHRALMDEAMVQLKLATELDPLSSVIWSNYGSVLSLAGRPAEGISALDRALTLQSNENPFLLAAKSADLVNLGRFTEAVALVRQLPREHRGRANVQLFVLARAGLKAEAEALLAEALSSTGRASDKIRSLLALGRTEEAMALLTPQKISRRSAADYLWDPIFDPLRHDPRWVKVMADAGLTEAHARAQAWRKANPPEKPAAR